MNQSQPRRHTCGDVHNTFWCKKQKQPLDKSVMNDPLVIFYDVGVLLSSGSRGLKVGDCTPLQWYRLRCFDQPQWSI